MAPLLRGRPIGRSVYREPVFLVDLAAFKPADDLRIDTERCAEACWSWRHPPTPEHPDGKPVSKETHSFVKTVFQKSGIDARGSYLPKNLHPLHTHGEPHGGQAESFDEARLVMGGVVSELLEKNNLKATDIDILVTSSSIFCPTPSIASLLINQLKMRDDVHAFHLGGMGCANGVVALTLLRSVLQAHPGALAVFVTCEITSAAFYRGENKHCLVSNALFRMGGSACLMTSGRAQRHVAKYELIAAERVSRAASDASYSCMFVGPDEEGLEGIHLYKDLPAEAGRALTAALSRIAPRVMDWPQYLQAAVVEARRRYHAYAHGGGKQDDASSPPPPPRFRPDWTRFIDHFLLHAGGHAVLTGIMAGMALPTSAVLPSFANLKDYGNTSSSTTWYAWAYLEATSGVKKGERVLQAGVGGGMKAAVVVWRAVRDVPRTPHRAWAHLPGGKPYAEEDMPRPITVEGTLTGLKEDGRPPGEKDGGGGGAQKKEQQEQPPQQQQEQQVKAGPDSPKTPGRGA